MKHLLNRKPDYTGLLIGIFLIVFAPGLFAQQTFTYERSTPPDMEMLTEAREVFEYEVSYGFITLGWIEVELLPDSTYGGEKVHHLRAVMRSNSRVLFIGKKEVHYHSLFQYNSEWPYALEFWRDDIHDEEYGRVRIRFDREEDKVRFYERGEFTESLDLEEPANGGLTGFYLSRMFAGIEEPYALPVYIENEKGSITSGSSPATEERSYEAFEHPVETYMSEGNADIDGPFGFSGEFKSWFATDDLRVPVEAHVKVIFGNVKIRLISYERQSSL